MKEIRTINDSWYSRCLGMSALSLGLLLCVMMKVFRTHKPPRQKTEGETLVTEERRGV